MFKCLSEEGLIGENPIESVKNVSEPAEQISILTADELKTILSVPSKRNYADFRDYILLYYLIDSMSRISEAINIRTQDFNFNEINVTIPASIAKNRKPRTIPLQKTTMYLIKELIEDNKADFDSDYVFLSNYGEKLTRHHFHHRLSEFAKAAGIEKPVYPHLIRHSAATIFLESGGDIRHLQLFLGHKDLRGYSLYTSISKVTSESKREIFCG